MPLCWPPPASTTPDGFGAPLGDQTPASNGVSDVAAFENTSSPLNVVSAGGAGEQLPGGAAGFTPFDDGANATWYLGDWIAAVGGEKAILEGATADETEAGWLLTDIQLIKAVVLMIVVGLLLLSTCTVIFRTYSAFGGRTKDEQV